jgi:hypothetical protein
MSGSVELFVAAMTGGVGTGITRSGTALTAKVVAGAGEDVLLVGRGTPSVLKPMADQLGARVLETSLRGKELYKHIYSEMKAD